MFLRRSDTQIKPFVSVGSVEIERMKPGYLKQVLIIEKGSFPSTWRKKMFKQVLSRKDSIFLVAKLENRIIGYIVALVEGTGTHIINFAVHPNFRRKGIGESLMARVIKQSLERGIAKVHLELRASNTIAKKLYEKFGFKSVGIRENYYPDNREDALVMWLEDIDSPEYVEWLNKIDSKKISIRYLLKPKRPSLFK